MDIASYTPRRLVLLLRASSKAEPIWADAKVHLASHIEHFGPKELWRTTLCFAENSHLDHAFSRLLSQQFQHVDYSQLSCRDMAKLAAALLEQEDHVGLDILSYVGMVFTMRVQEAKTEDLVTVAEAFARAEIADTVLFQRIAMAAVVSLAAFKQGEIVRLLLSFALLQIENEALFTKAAELLKKPWEPEELAHIAFSYARFYLAVPTIQNLLTKRVAEAIPHLSPVQQLELIVSFDRLELLEPNQPFSLQNRDCSTSLFCKAAGALLQVRQKERIGDLQHDAWSRTDYCEEDKMHLFLGLSCYKSDWDFEKYPISFFASDCAEMSVESLALGFKALRNVPPSVAREYVPAFAARASALIRQASPDYATSLRLSAAMCGQPLEPSNDSEEDERVRFFSGMSVVERRWENPTVAARDLCTYLGDEYAPWEIGPYCIDARGPNTCFVFIWPKDYTHGELSYEAVRKLEQFKKYGSVTPVYFSKWRNGWKP